MHPIDPISPEPFLAIEAEESLFTHRVLGQTYWGEIRGVLWNYYILPAKLDLEAPQPAAHPRYEPSILKAVPAKEQLKSRRDRLRRALRERGQKPHRAEVLFLGTGRKVLRDGLYVCPYTDDIKQGFDDALTIEPSYKGQHFHPSLNPDVTYSDYASLLADDYLWFRRVFRPNAHRSTVRKLAAFLAPVFERLGDAYGIQLDTAAIVGWVADRVTEKRMKMWLFKRLLRSIRPRVLVACDLGLDNMRFIEAANGRSIPTVLLQYAPFDKYVLAFQYATKGPVPNLPSSIFLYSEYWKDQIRVPIPDERLLPVGGPYFEITRERYERAPEYGYEKNVLFVSQRPIGRRLSEFALAAHAQLTAAGYGVIYKLHPGEYADWETRYPALVDSGIEVVGSHSANLYECFARSRAQVGVYSSALYEGIGFGLDTFLINEGPAYTMSGLVDAGLAQWISEPHELTPALEQPSLKSPEHAEKIDSFWKRGSLPAIESEIRHLMAR